MEIDRRLFEGKVISSKIYPLFFPIKPQEHVVNFGCGVGPQAVVYKGMYAEMVGVDLNEERLEMSKVLLRENNVEHYRTVCAPVEQTGLPDASFEKALAIDIIEHLPSPEAFLREALRVLKPRGKLLVSVPAMHDHYTHSIKKLAGLLGKKTATLPEGHLDAHNSEYSLRGWGSLIRSTGFVIKKTRASTLWPPLHLYGVPRFWFTNPLIHWVDNALCQLPILKRFGQASLLILEKP